MSISLQFTGKIDRTDAQLGAANILSEERSYRLSSGERGL